MTTIRELMADELPTNLDALAEILNASVNAGASIGFIQPFSANDGRAFWRRKVFPSVAEGGRILLVAETEARIVGTVQLDIDLPPNQPHRGEVAKLIVHPDFRGRGIAKRLMVALEDRARDLGKRLLTLDTKTGDAAEPLYSSLGFEIAGVIPGYCRAPEEDRYDSTTYMYKAL